MRIFHRKLFCFAAPKKKKNIKLHVPQTCKEDIIILVSSTFLISPLLNSDNEAYRVSQRDVYAFGGLWNKICLADIQNRNVNQSVKG